MHLTAGERWELKRRPAVFIFISDARAICGLEGTKCDERREEQTPFGRRVSGASTLPDIRRFPRWMKQIIRDAPESTKRWCSVTAGTTCDRDT